MRGLWKTHLGDRVAYDPQYHDSVRAEIASFVSEAPGLVLDVGCGGGATGRLLKQKFPGTRVVGIESNPRAAEHARAFLDDVIGEPIETALIAERLQGARIDLVLLLDVLEHLYDPWRSLVRVRSWLAPETRVLASVPNVRNLVTLDDLAAPIVSRNSPCPCGSGKRYKDCQGAIALTPRAPTPPVIADATPVTAQRSLSYRPSGTDWDHLGDAEQSACAVLMQRALKQQRGGRLADAAACYREVLALAPNTHDALHMLGAIELRHGNFSEAKELIVAALRLRPPYPD